MPTKVLITGSNGMLGHDVSRYFLTHGAYKVYGISRQKAGNMVGIIHEQVDLTDTSTLQEYLHRTQPDLIVNCAANVSIENCEVHKADTHKLHVESTKVLAAYQPNKTQFVSISTDAVFDGKKGGYTELDIPNPLNYYAQTKLEGEKIALQENPHALVLRTTMYGFHQPPKNSLFEWAMSSLKKNEVILGFTDVIFNPMYTSQLAESIFRLVEIKKTGLLHVGAHQTISKYAFLQKLAQKWHFPGENIRQASIDQLESSVLRPKNTSLDVQQFEKILQTFYSVDTGIELLKETYEANSDW